MYGILINLITQLWKLYNYHKLSFKNKLSYLRIFFCNFRSEKKCADMKDIAKRFLENPILVPNNIAPSNASMHVICLLNPGVFKFEGKIWMLIRVAENVSEKKGFLSIPILKNANIDIIEVSLDDAELIATDPRVINYKGLDYLTTISHLRAVCSDDGVHFTEPKEPISLYGHGNLEKFGIEDCRVTKVKDTFYLTYTAVSENGVGVGLRTTKDWKNFDQKGMIIAPHNKDCTFFDEKINGKFYALHRPSSVEIGGNFIWISESPDGVHWGNHQCIVKTRANFWDSKRIGAGASPIKTEKGWLEIYHGADASNRYCLGAFLMDIENPAKVISRTSNPIMVPTEEYELNGFFGKVVFTNGHIVDGDKLTIYYGASDEFVCGAHFSISEILSMLD